MFPGRYPSGHIGRRAMRLARFRVALAAYTRIQQVVAGFPGNRDDEERRPASKEVTDITDAAGAAVAQQEAQLMRWSLRDVAARVVQEEIRNYARFRMALKRYQQQRQQHDDSRLTFGYPTPASKDRATSSGNGMDTRGLVSTPSRSGDSLANANRIVSLGPSVGDNTFAWQGGSSSHTPDSFLLSRMSSESGRHRLGSAGMEPHSSQLYDASEDAFRAVARQTRLNTASSKSSATRNTVSSKTGSAATNSPRSETRSSSQSSCSRPAFVAKRRMPSPDAAAKLSCGGEVINQEDVALDELQNGRTSWRSSPEDPHHDPGHHGVHFESRPQNDSNGDEATQLMESNANYGLIATGASCAGGLGLVLLPSEKKKKRRVNVSAQARWDSRESSRR